MDTTVTGTGAADPPYSFSFPKFDPTLGLLMEVGIASVVSLKIDFTIENPLPTSQNVRMRFIRADEISSAALLSPLDNTAYSPGPSSWHGPYSLLPSDGVSGSGFDFRAVSNIHVLSNDTIINERLFNTADYLGPGAVSFDYSPSLSPLPSVTSINFNGSAQDQIKFIVTYTYCNNSALAADVTTFTAVKKEKGVANVRWSTDNERNDRKYELQKSLDGLTFTSVLFYPAVADLNGGGKYQYNYKAEANELSKLVFRIKQTEKDGLIKYSQIRVVDLSEINDKPGIRLYPNPAKGTFTVEFYKLTRSDWQLDILSSSGQVLSRTLASNSLLAKMNTDGRLASGVYFVRAINMKTKEQFVERLLVKK